MRRINILLQDYCDLQRTGASKSASVGHLGDVRGRLGWALSDISHALARLGHRICPDVPDSYDEAFEDGRAYGERRPDARLTRAKMVGTLERLGLPTDDATLAKFGFPTMDEVAA